MGHQHCNRLSSHTLFEWPVLILIDLFAWLGRWCRFRSGLPDAPHARPESPEPAARKPHKKALLIGIQGQADGKESLKGPHTDVAGLRELLIGALDLSVP